MTWKPIAEGEVPTLGWEIIDWIEANIVIPDGDHAGDLITLSDSQREFILSMYALHVSAAELVAADRGHRPNRAFIYPRGAMDIEPQKSGKSPFAAAIAIAEGMAPALFDGWSADGRPVGRPWNTARIAITAQSEDQSKNVWDALYSMVDMGDLKAELGDSKELGVTRIILPLGGHIMPVTASAKSRQGARITFAVQDETQGWTKENKGEKLADTQYRSLAGMGGRFLQLGNAWDPNERSVAQQTWEKGVGVFKRMTPSPTGSIRNKRERMHVLKVVYRDSPWVPLDLVSDTIDDFLARGDTAQAERYFFNRIVPSEDRAFDQRMWSELKDSDYLPKPGTTIVVGVDGARYKDAIGMIAVEVKTGFAWPLGIWERPDNAPEDYEHPFDEVDGALIDAYSQYNIWRVYVDPGSQMANISPLMERWQGRWGAKKIIEWLMIRPKATAMAIRNLASAIQSGDIKHDGDATLSRHIGNARRRQTNVKDEQGEVMHILQKESPDSDLKIDGASALVLAWEARGDALSAGAVALGRYDDPSNTCASCGHLRRHHVPRCRGRPPGHCNQFKENE